MLLYLSLLVSSLNIITFYLRHYQYKIEKFTSILKFPFFRSPSTGKRTPQTEPVDYSASPRPIGSYDLMSGDVIGSGRVGAGGGSSCFSRDSSPDSAASPYMDAYGQDASGTLICTLCHVLLTLFFYFTHNNWLIYSIFRLQPPSGQQLRHDAHRLSGWQQCIRILLQCSWAIPLCEPIWKQSLHAGARSLLVRSGQWIWISGIVVLSNGDAIVIALGQSQRKGMVKTSNYLLSCFFLYLINIYRY